MRSKLLTSLFAVAFFAQIAFAATGTPEDDYNRLVARIQSNLANSGRSNGKKDIYHQLDIQTAYEAVRQELGDTEATITIETMTVIQMKHPNWSAQTALFFAIGMGHSPDKDKFKL